MAARKKQAFPTLDELRLTIRDDTKIRWANSEPLFGLGKTQNGVAFVPVDPRIENEVVLLWILEPTGFNTERVLEFIAILKSRYPRLPWITVLVFDLKYLFTQNKEFLDRFEKYPMFDQVPLYLDPYGQFWEWAKMQDHSKCIVYRAGNPVQELLIDQNAPKTFLDIESLLQDQLRVADPGLALPLLYEYEADAPIDIRRPSWDELKCEGRWHRPTDRSLVTDDLHGKLRFYFKGKNLRLSASLHSQARETSSQVKVFLNEKPIPAENVGPVIAALPSGETFFEIDRHTGIFDVITSKTTIEGNIRLEFVDAANSPVVLWAIQFGDFLEQT